MRLLITGLNGTLAPKAAAAATARGIDVIGWDRQALPPDDDADASRRWLSAQRPDAILHLATGSVAWAALLAGHAAAHGLPLVFTSSAMVFHHAPDGPHLPQDARTAQDGYGRSKIASEDAVLAACPQASVLRIGWQIDAAAQGNNMLVQLDGWQAREGHVAASTVWRPACSFMDDTVAALLGLVQQPQPGVLHMDSNADEGHTFDRIVLALQQAFGRSHWAVQATAGYRHDQRLAGGLAAPPLSQRLPGLRHPA